VILGKKATIPRAKKGNFCLSEKNFRYCGDSIVSNKFCFCKYTYVQKIEVHVVCKKARVHPYTGTEALYRPYGP